MSSFTDFLEKELLDHVFGGADYTRPATLHIGLSTTTPTDAGGNITQPSGNGYTRVAVTNNSTNFPAASGTTATKSNGTKITFPTATGAWGTVTHFFIADDPTAGNILAWGILGTSKTPTTGDVCEFAIGQLTITLD